MALSVKLIHKDARTLSTSPTSSSSPAALDLPRPADIVVFEVFDNGLLGEGVLQVLAGLHRQGAVGPHTTLIPCSAQLFCQPIQLLQGSTEDDGMDLAPWSVFESSEGYVGLDLAPISHQAGEYHSIVHSPAGAWRPLAQPARAFCFDFYSTAHKSPEQHSLSLVCHTSGKVNAVAFWFTLDLCKDDGHRSVIQLSTDPLKNSPGSRTWQVAVQHLGPSAVEVIAGQTIEITASHDTYAMAFNVCTASSDGKGAGGPTSDCSSMPGADPVWSAHHSAVKSWGQGIMRSVTSDPLAFRQLARATTMLAARPACIPGARAGQAACFASKLMH